MSEGLKKQNIVDGAVVLRRYVLHLQWRRKLTVRLGGLSAGEAK